MKTKLLYAALFLSPAIFAQEATIKTNQAIEVKTALETKEQPAVSAGAAVNSSAAVRSTNTTMHQAGEAAIQSQAKTRATVSNQKARVATKTGQVITTVKQDAPKAKISTGTESSAGISAGRSNKINAVSSLDNQGGLSPQRIKSGTAASNDLAIKSGKVNATTKSAVKTTTVIKPKPVGVKNKVMSNNSTLLKIR